MNCNCNNNYYVDENGQRHTDIPMGTSPQAAYARTNLLLKDKVDQIENEMADVQKALTQTKDNVNQSMESLSDSIHQDLDEMSESIETGVNTALSGINARVDNIITHNNDTEGNTELIDIRTGADGTVYTSAGNAVREQISTLTTILESFVKCCDHRVLSSDDPYYNADNVPSGKIVAYTTVGENIPFQHCNLFCFEGSSMNGRTQMCINRYLKLSFRSRWNNEWSEWVEFADKNTMQTAINQKFNEITVSESDVHNAHGFVNMGRVNDLSLYSDANLAPINSMLMICCNGFANLPEGLIGMGSLITFADTTYSPSPSGTIQIYVDADGKMAVRNGWSNTWHSWKKILSDNEITSLIDNKISNFALENPHSDYYCSFSLFETIGVVGDSYASGAYGDNANAQTAVDHINHSWPQILARKNGCSVTNYTRGGRSTRSFLTDTIAGLSQLLSDAPKGLYILVLERNDYNIESRGENGYLGNISDITSYSLGSYPDTFYGNYASIIERIMSHAPSAKIVLMSGDFKSTNELGTRYNQAVEEIAGLYDLPCMVQLDEPFFDSDYYRRNWAAGGHPSAIIYSGMEAAIERLFNKCVKDNKSYFTYL